jgi:hypothetical protein
MRVMDGDFRLSGLSCDRDDAVRGFLGFERSLELFCELNMQDVIFQFLRIGDDELVFAGSHGFLIFSRVPTICRNLSS